SRRGDEVARWLEEGAVIQVNAGSLCGDNGSEAEATAGQWLEAGQAALVAGDAHGASRRPPRMSQAIARMEKRLGRGLTRTVCLENPGRLYSRQQLLPPVRRTTAGGTT